MGGPVRGIRRDSPAVAIRRLRSLAPSSLRSRLSALAPSSLTRNVALVNPGFMSVGGWLVLLVMLVASSRAPAWEGVGARWADYAAYVAPIDAAMKSRLQAIADDGADQGRVPGRMGQI